MTIRPLDHTADLGVEIDASSLEDLYAQAARAFCDTITDAATVRPRQRRRLRVVAPAVPRPDHEALMVEWLEELLYRFETEGWLYSRAEITLGESPDDGLELAAEVAGEPFDPDRHPQKVAIKGITYHALAVEQHGDGWRARVIFDI